MGSVVTNNIDMKETKHQLKKKFRKEAKLQQRALKKSEKLIGPMVTGIC